MQGGLQSITNTTVRGQQVPARAYTEVTTKTVVPAIPEGLEPAKTPSPKKLSIKIEPPSGKENVTVSPSRN